MTGRGFRVPGRDEWYSFTYVGAASGLLDRLYEGPTNALSQYKIYQAIYALSATTKLVKSLTLPGWGPLTRTSPGELNASAPSRTTFAAPSSFAPYMDDSEDPPHLQIELYPVPDAVYSIMLASTAEARGISGTGTTLLPWMRPSCLFAGAVADAFLHAKDINSAMAWEVKYKERLADMVRTENASSGPLVMTLDDYYTRHRMRRFQR
jgi:hypothetical protein